MTLEHYAQASDGEHPFVPEGEPVHLSPPGPGDQPDFAFSPIWWISRYWPALMHDIAPWEEHYETWLSPGLLSQRDRDMPWSEEGGPVWDSGVVVSYRYSNSFIARPVVWGDGESQPTDADIRPTRRSEVRHPSSKVIMMDVDLAYLPRPVPLSSRRPVLFADLSSSAVLDSEATTPVQNPLYFEPPRFYHDTPNGIDGRDF